MQASRDKILVIGPHLAGKTTLVQALSETEPLPDQLTRPDFGQVTAPDGRVLYLLGAPGQLGLHMAFQALEGILVGVIVVVDSADPSTFTQVAQMLDLVQISGVRSVVVANKQDLPDAVSVDALHEALRLSDSATPVMPCQMENVEQAQAILGFLLSD